MVATRALIALSALGAMAPAKNQVRPVLMVADEIPAMETLAREIDRRVSTPAEITTQDKLPADLGRYPAVVVYIHRKLAEATESALLAYAEAGGKLVVLHHSISSGKRANKGWFPALGVTLPTGDFEAGGYKYIDDVTFDVVSLAPRHPVLRGVKFPRTVAYHDGKKRPAFAMEQTEIYLNHVLAGPRTPLLGLRFQDDKTGKVYLQDSAGWERPLGKGHLFYFMPGHKASDFENPIYAQILANVINGNPERVPMPSRDGTRRAKPAAPHAIKLRIRPAL